MAENPPSPTPEQIERFRDMVYNIELSRARLFNQLFDPRRDFYDECGWPKTNPPPEDYLRLYDRDPIAARVIELMPKECWQVRPQVYEEEDGETVTEFEAAWDEMCKGLRSEKSWHKNDDGSALWEYHERLDILSGVGRYGVMLYGFNDVVGDDLTQPVKVSKALRLNYLRVFPEALAKITQYETDVNSPRFGLPTMYDITFNDPRDQLTGIGVATTTKGVHWQRILHVPSDGGASSSEFVGPERCRGVLNHLLDLQKVYGASSEGYWKACFTLLTAETHPSLGGEVEVNERKIKDMFEQMMNGLQRTGVLMGMSLKSTAPAVVDPTPHIDKGIEAICIKIGCPVPVFKGYEIGEQASTENRGQWDDRVKKRQHERITAKQIAPFTDRLIMFGLLPEPQEFCVYWPDLAENSDDEKADTSLKIIQAIAAYVTSGANVLMTPFDFFTQVLKWPDDVAKSITENSVEAIGDSDAGVSPMTGLATGLTGIIELFKAASAGAVSEEQLKAILIMFFKLSEDQADEVIADGLTPAAQEAADPTPVEPEPLAPVKLKEGEKLVNPNPVVGK